MVDKKDFGLREKAMIAAGGIGVLGKIAGGIGAARAAGAAFSDEDARRLNELKRRRAQGDLGLTEGQRGMAEAGAQVQRGAALRDLQAMPVTMAPGNREAFLGALGTQNALMEARQASARDIAKMDMEAAQVQREEISTLAGEQSTAEAARKSALLSALGGTAEVVGATGLGVASSIADKRAKEAEDKAGVEAELAIIRELRTSLGQKAPIAPGALGAYSGFFSNPSPTFR
jgi:hypothetical protein